MFDPWVRKILWRRVCKTTPIFLPGESHGHRSLGGLQSRRSQRNMTEATQCTRTPEHTLEGLMLKLKLQYFAHMMGRVDSLEKTLMLRKIEGERRRG